jgi:hypothetical protein
LRMADVLWSWEWFAALGDLSFSSWNNSWLLALLLLGWLLAACPSRPGRTTGCLPFSSWDGSWASSFQCHGFAGWYGGDVLENCVILLLFGLAEWVVLPLAVHFSSSCWLSWLLWCCQHSVRWLSCLWAACLCVSPSFSLIHSSLSCDVVVAYVLVHMCVVPKFKEHMLYLIIILNDANGKVFCPSLRVIYTNPNFYSYLFIYLFIFLQVIRSRLEMMKISVDS